MPDPGTSTRRPFDPAIARRTLFQALAEARREHGAGTVALVDGDERTLTYDDIIQASFALGSALKRGTRARECVGVMLPTGAAAALTFFALSAYGRVPTMLNFTSGLSGLKS
ncbi:MAG TPA: AMP-binding protein, partial [Rhizomicrobium sp.]|nr:AMP-binding protein [Rhizomicrobium sp.]